MNTNKFWGLIVCLLISHIGFAQKDTKLTREVLFTLGANERIYFNEYYVATNFSNKKFVAITENTLTKEYSLIYNGKSIAKTKGNYSSEVGIFPFGVFYFDEEKENGFGYSYELAGRTFVNIGNKVLPNVNGIVSNFMITKNGKYAFHWGDMENVSIYVDGKTFGPYENSRNIKISESGNFIFDYLENRNSNSSNRFVNVNGEIFGPYYCCNHDYVVAMNDKGYYAFSYIEDDKFYGNVNGKIFGPYRKKGIDIKISNNGESYAVKYHEDRTHYINIDKKKAGAFYHIYSASIADNNNYAYRYQEDLNDNKQYVIVNGKKWGPFQYIYDTDPIAITNAGKYAFKYHKNNKYFVNINGNDFGPYESVQNVKMSNDGEYVYTYESNGKEHTNYNGKITDYYRNVAIANNGKIAYSYGERDKSYVNIGGEIFGPFQGIYDVEITNNGKYGYVYEMDWKKYTNVNGNVFGPYRGGLYDICVTDDGKYAFAYEDNNKQWYANINGNIYGPFDYVSNVVISDKGDYSFQYNIKNNDTYRNSNYYTNINGQVYNGYNSVGFSENGKCIFEYIDTPKDYVDINGKTYGPYEQIRRVLVIGNDKYAFEYKNDNNLWKYNINGIENESIDNFNSLLIQTENNARNLNFPHYGWSGEPFENFFEITSKDGQHLFYSTFAYEYVVIDGNPIGRSPALDCFYNDKNHSFVWNAIEGKELVVYEYKLDK